MDRMVKPLSVLVVIPARGGSKGIPGKNIRSFSGYPLIAWSIAAGKNSKYQPRVIVSTDDSNIAAVAREWGAETPFLRPAEFAQDNTTDLPVFEHALEWLRVNEGYEPDLVIQLRPTSPIRPITCVDDAIDVFLAHPDADSVRGVVPAGQNPHKMWRLDPDGVEPMRNFMNVPGIDEPYNAPRQILPPIYWQTGHIDVIKPAVILNGSMSGNRIYPTLIDPAFTVDLDNLNDWTRAEWLAKYGGLAMVTPGKTKRPIPKKISLLALDFDGIVTDNRVWVNQNGEEMIAANRSDSLIMDRLREKGTEIVIISSETNPVVSARAKKMRVEAIQGVGLKDKAEVLSKLCAERGIPLDEVVFAGNDINDIPCFKIVGWAVTVPDGMNEALSEADHITIRTGGHGAVREICDLIIYSQEKK